FEIDLSKTTAMRFGVLAKNSKGETFSVGYDSVTDRFFTDRTYSGKVDFSPEFANSFDFAPRASRSNVLKLHLVFDAASVELFADGGAIAMTDIFFPTTDFTDFEFAGVGGKTEVIKAQSWNLK